MTIAATSRATATESVRDTRMDFDRSAATDDFAGILAGAVKSTAPKPEPRKAKEGTSELDKPEKNAVEDDDRKRVKRGRARAAQSAAETTDTGEVVKATSALDPELQEKLARVMARMRDETGHDVKVTETYRSQDRQDALFAQGRDTTGPVVTWTRNSKHTQGRAVDVVLQGGAAPTLDAYTTLQRIANEEGLRTLGARDPGHLELPGLAQSGAAGASDVTPPVPAEPADASGRGQVSIARLAEVAQVAQVSVAKPAEVARVAPVARPEIPGVTARPAAVASGQHTHVAVEDVKASGGNASSKADSRDADSGDTSSGGGNTRGEQRYSALAAAVALRDAPAQSPASAITGATVMSGAERAAQIIAAYQDAPARPLSQITMAVDAGNGLTDRVQIAMRGSSLNAAIEAGDARGAEAMRSRTDELVRALARDGIDVEALRIRGAAGHTTVAATNTQTSSDTASHSRFERQQQWQQHDRQRSQDDRREQQRQQRGGKGQ